MKKFILLTLVLMLLVYPSTLALAMDKNIVSPEYVIPTSKYDIIKYNAAPIINDSVLFARAVNGINDCPPEIANAVIFEMQGMYEDVQVFDTTQKLQERITPDGLSIDTYATTAYVVESEDLTYVKSQPCLYGDVTMKLYITYDTFTNSSGQKFTSPKKMTYTYVSKENSSDSVTSMSLHYKTGTNGYNSNGDRVTTTPSSGSTSKTNPVPGNSISLTYQYGGTRFFKYLESSITGQHFWAGGSNQDPNSMTIKL